jgi:hypothetical protein
MHKGFKCLDLSSGRIYISRDVVFDENIFPFFQASRQYGPSLALRDSTPSSIVD